MGAPDFPRYGVIITDADGKVVTRTYFVSARRGAMNAYRMRWLRNGNPRGYRFTVLDGVKGTTKTYGGEVVD